MPTVLNVDIILAAIALIIIIGYISEVIFKITRFPEVVIMILIGVLLVPIGHILPSAYTITLRSLAPLFGSIALIMIMFSSGKLVRLKNKRLEGSVGLWLALTDIALSMAVVSAFMYFVFKWPLVDGALLGAVLGETSTVMVLPFIRRIKIDSELYNILVAETTFNSIVCILAFYVLLDIITGTLSATSYVQYIVSYLSIAVFLGAVAGIFWIFMMSTIKGARSYLATFAVVVLLYALVDLLSGAAVLAVLVFAILIGNGEAVARYLNFGKYKEPKESKIVERELEFLVRTFFFVFIGMISVLSVTYFLYALIAVALLMLIRKIQVRFLMDGMQQYKKIVYAMVPRGLTVAVLASILFALNGFYFTQIFYISFMGIIITNLLFAVLASSSARGIALVKPVTAAGRS